MKTRARTSMGLALGVVAAVSACGGSDAPEGGNTSPNGGGGSTSGGGASSTSGGGGSSGAYDCSPPYKSSAKVTFEEDNASDRLVGITIDSCQGAACAIGSVKRHVYEKTVYGQPETVVAYEIGFTTKPDGVNVGASLTARPDGKLRFEMSWMVPYDGPSEATAKDGETFTVRAYFGGDGANTFEHSFVGDCTQGQCGTGCKLSPTP